MHDTNSMQDEKIAELFMRFDYMGTGLFFAILEKIALKEEPVKTEVLKSQLRLKKKHEKIWEFLHEIELIFSENGKTFNKKLQKYIEKIENENEKTRNRVAQHRDRERNKENVTRNNGVTERDCNAPNYNYNYNYNKERDKEREKKPPENEENSEEKIPVVDLPQNKIFDIEQELLKNRIQFEKICMATRKDEEPTKTSLRKFHLHLQENDRYPLTRVAAFAGFEKWLMNEKNFLPQIPEAKKNTGIPKNLKNINS